MREPLSSLPTRCHVALCDTDPLYPFDGSRFAMMRKMPARRVGDPLLGAVDHVVVALFLGARFERKRIASRSSLGESKHPTVSVDSIVKYFPDVVGAVRNELEHRFFFFFSNPGYENGTEPPSHQN